MKRSLQCALIAVPMMVLGSACGSSSSGTSAGSGSGAGTASEGPLHGTFVPVGSTADAQFASITFSDATHYALLRANCSASCGSSGTYTFDGVSNLELTDASTKHTQHVDFQATRTSAATVLQSLHVLGGSSLVGDGGLLVSDGGSLLQQILQALVNGILMALEGDGAGSGDASTASSSGDDDDDSGASSDPDAAAASTLPPKSDVDVRGAIAELKQQLSTAPLQTYYQDGTRIEGCFANPVGKDLSAIQKSFYCSMPLEFRLCNSIVLLQQKDVASRWQGYLQCQQRVDAIAGGTGAYLYDAKINATYYWLQLNGDSELSAADEASVVAANEPAASGKSFTTLLGEITASLSTEAADAAFTGLQDLVNQAESAASAAGSNIAERPTGKGDLK